MQNKLMMNKTIRRDDIRAWKHDNAKFNLQ